MIMIAIPDN